METLTVKQGYIAMYKFLQELQRMTNSDDLAGFLDGMSFLEDGGTADPAAWHDWLEAVRKTLADDTPPLLTFIS